MTSDDDDGTVVYPIWDHDEIDMEENANELNAKRKEKEELDQHINEHKEIGDNLFETYKLATRRAAVAARSQDVDAAREWLNVAKEAWLLLTDDGE